MFSFLKSPIEYPRSGRTFIVIAILAIVLMISNLARGSRYFGYYLLTFGILIFISGVGMAFSKKERAHVRAKLSVELPDQAALINTSDADRIAQRRGYYSMVVGATLFLIWCWFFGFSTLAAGV